MKSAPLLIVAALCSCSKLAPREPGDTSGQPAADTPPAAQSSSTPTPQLAPEGVFFLLTPTSIVTSDGVTGLRPGTRLQKVGPGRYQAEGQTLELMANQVTNDLRIAARVAGADQAAQAAIRQNARGANQEIQVVPVKVVPIPQLPPAPAPNPAAPVSLATPPPLRINPLDAPARKVNPDYDDSGRYMNRRRIH